MNALTVLSIAAAVAYSSGQLLTYSGLYGGYPGIHGAYPGTYGAYPGVYGAYPGVYGAYHGLLPAASPITFKSVAASPITIKAAPSPITINAVAPTPLTYNVAPVAPVTPVQSQYHAQDELGQYSFGYSGGPSSRAETRDAFGIVRGSYNYVDANGKIQTQQYVADALGFRVAGTDLPVAPDAPPATLGSLPEPVQDTAEVAAAKAAFKTAYDEAAAAAAAAPDTRKKRSISTIPALGAYSPLRFSYGFNAPLTYAHAPVIGSPLTYTAAFPGLTTYNAAPAIPTYTGAPALGYTAAVAAPAAALRDAQLLRIVHNPGHAVSYRVD
ncbi:cuticle protein 19.8 [Procambarus clarkii]|uniref:cuticle protein 19.8 n=1 Tax=Procambarus clarkii TaxID=6728 RepID=UPI003742E097